MQKKAAEKKVDVVADTKVVDIPLDPRAMVKEEDDEEIERRESMLPAEEHWEREALISTKSKALPSIQRPPLHACRVGRRGFPESQLLLQRKSNLAL